MKKLMTIFGAILFASTILTSCGGDDKSEEEISLPDAPSDINYSGEEEFDSESSSNSESNEMSSSSVDCDEFLEEYEEFMDEYIAIIKKMQKNPDDMSVMTDYTSMMTEATEWTEKTADCAADAQFASKFAEIQMKIANAAAGM